MKRLFSVFMLAVVATVAFAFTTPKEDSNAFATLYRFDKATSQWVSGSSPVDCNGSAFYCEISFADQYAQYSSQILAQLGTSIPTGAPASINVTVNLSGGGTASVPVSIDYQP